MESSKSQILALFAAGMTSIPCHALELRDYSETDHKRFIPFPGFPALPTKNPNQLFANLDLTGIGWQSNSPDIQYALVSRQHVVFATHFATVLGGSPIRFINASGDYVSRTGPTVTTIQDGDSDSDLTLITLNAPIDDSDAVSPLPYLDLPSLINYDGSTLGIAGKRDEGNGNKFQVIGRSDIAEVEGSSRTLDYGPPGSPRLLKTRYMRFDYSKLFGSDDDCRFEVGDSGSPSFVPVGSQAALVGTNSYVDPNPLTRFENFSAFVPHYISELDAEMEPLGYRMRPVNALGTTLTTATLTNPSAPRKAKPLDFTYTLRNTGSEVTGNLEIEFQFEAGEAPDTITAPGWTSYGSDTKWTLRKATLDPSVSGTATATWLAAPSIDTLSIGLTRRSDTTSDFSQTENITLAPSFADWAGDLAESGENDDPDRDGLENIIEYALGGDPESSVLVFADGGPLQPVMAPKEGMITVSHPERIDKVQRGLIYTIEFSDSLTDWNQPPPADLDTTTIPYNPAVEGFVNRIYTWTPASTQEFAHLKIELNE